MSLSVQLRNSVAGLVLVVAGVALPGAPTAAAEGSPVEWPSKTADAPPRLTTVKARHVGEVDRVRFRFRGGLPQGLRVGSTAKRRTVYALPNVTTTVQGGDIEGRVTYGIGVRTRTSYTVTQLHHPDRIVIDVATGADRR